MTEKYGLPNRMNPIEVVWYDNGPWRRTVVHRISSSNFLGIKDNDYLEQTLSYPIPDDKIPALKRFSSRIDVDQNNGELSSRGETESVNFLTMNLAAEIAAGARTPENARAFDRKTRELAKSGKSSLYLQEFLFPRRPP
jgi:hypothetical protein